VPHSVVWSVQDASYILADQAARLLDEPEGCRNSAPSMGKLALELGISGRQLRRIFKAPFGVSHIQHLQTRRLLTARQLLADTLLPVTQIALMSGFASVRRINAAFVAHYKLNPRRACKWWHCQRFTAERTASGDKPGTYRVWPGWPKLHHRPDRRDAAIRSSIPGQVRGASPRYKY